MAVADLLELIRPLTGGHGSMLKNRLRWWIFFQVAGAFPAARCLLLAARDVGTQSPFVAGQRRVVVPVGRS
jgi:hypothetical protein